MEWFQSRVRRKGCAESVEIEVPTASRAATVGSIAIGGHAVEAIALGPSSQDNDSKEGTGLQRSRGQRRG